MYLPNAAVTSVPGRLIGATSKRFARLCFWILIVCLLSSNRAQAQVTDDRVKQLFAEEAGKAGSKNGSCNGLLTGLMWTNVNTAYLRQSYTEAFRYGTTNAPLLAQCAQKSHKDLAKWAFQVGRVLAVVAVSARKGAFGGDFVSYTREAMPLLRYARDHNVANAEDSIKSLNDADLTQYAPEETPNSGASTIASASFPAPGKRAADPGATTSPVAPPKIDPRLGYVGKPVDAATLDVSGVRLYMSAAEVVSARKKHYGAAAKIWVSKFPLKQTVEVLTCEDGVFEVHVHFVENFPSNSNHPESAYAISYSARGASTNYSPREAGTAGDLELLRAAALEKYGTPATYTELTTVDNKTPDVWRWCSSLLSDPHWDGHLVCDLRDQR
jgi:hypothetical protein